ncbi:Pentatricopeptide repeat-containing protein At2g31400, partial [Durusdinium trenchii]
AAHWLEALALQRRMRGQALRVDSISCSAAISACAASGAPGRHWFIILGLLDEMQELLVSKDSVTYTAALQGMGEERWQTALALFQQMTDESIKKDLVAYNAAMSACGGAWPHALALLQSVPHELGADAVSFGSVISACEKSGEWQAAVLLLQRMFVASVQLTAVALAAALSACARCAQWVLALTILEAQKTVELDVVVYNAAIAACEKGSAWEAAMALLGRLTLSAVELSWRTFSSAISACAKPRRWREALELLRMVPWETSACGAAMRACSYDWARTLHLYQEMTLALVHKDADIYATVTAASFSAVKPGLLREALVELEDVAFQGLKLETTVH